jgi:hypothetical protein
VRTPTLKLPFRLRVQYSREAQKVDRLRTLPAAFARVSLCESTKFDELGLGRFQGQAELPQPLAQSLLNSKGIFSVLETQHKVVDVSQHVGFAPQARLDHALEPEVERVVQVHVAQQDADRTTLWRSLLVRMNHSVFQNACFQPAPDQADQARISDSVLNKPEQPLVT